MSHLQKHLQDNGIKPVSSRKQEESAKSTSAADVSQKSCINMVEGEDKGRFTQK